MELKKAKEIFGSCSKRAASVRHALDILNYDGMTCAPKNSAAGRALTSAELTRAMHEIKTSAEYVNALETLCAHGAELDSVLKREAEYALAEARGLLSVPPEVYAGHARVTGEAFAAWHTAKEQNDFALLAPLLERVFDSARLVARHAAPGADAYDYWLDQSERGMDSKTLDGFFDTVEKELTPLIGAISALPKPDNTFLYGNFEKSKQQRLSRRLMELMGIDASRCTIAEAEHPYTTVIGRNDVRITTHYYVNYVAANMFTVLHEGGHALYALNLAPELSGTALEFAASASMNEAISRFYENIIGRSREFAWLILPELKRLFPAEFEGVGPEQLFRAVNRVEPSLKRTEADELTYPLHVLIRYRLEKALMRGELNVRELPEAWNAYYKEYLGIEPADDSSGCLQDMHWASGLIGYFPTYALGNAYGAQLLSAMQKDTDIYGAVASGDIPAVTRRLADSVLKYGRLKEPAELIYASSGAEFEPNRYTDYLKSKYSALYGL